MDKLFHCAAVFLTLSIASLALGESMLRGPGKELFVYPKTFGNFSLQSCSSAPSCGTTMATYNGIPAKSNGANQCTGNSCAGYGTYGYQYQCVELAQRYFGELYGTTPIWYGNAIDICNTFPSGVVKTSSPIAGDLVVFNTGTYGHVAVITHVGGGYVDVIEQNSSPTGTNTYSMSSNVQCYLHATKNSGSCPNKGWYCGNDGVDKDPNVNYLCSATGGSITNQDNCKTTCVTMPSGYDDKCTSNGSCDGLHGYYCGNDKVNGDADTLYLCLNGEPSGATYCSNGCHVASSGYDDYCN